MSHTGLNKASNGNNMPDLEDWWGDFEINVTPPPPKRPLFRVFDNPRYYDAEGRPLREPRKKTRTISPTMLASAVGAALVVLAFTHISQISTIHENSKQMSALRTEIAHLTNEHRSNEIRIDNLANIDRVRDEAVLLGMAEPAQDQIRRIQMPESNSEKAVMAAENSGVEIYAP